MPSASRTKFHLLWSFFMLFLLVMPASPGHALDLLDAYRQAEATDPLLAATASQLKADKAGRPLARAALLPKLTTSAEAARNKAHITGAAPATISESFWGEQYSITLLQPFFDGQAYVSLRSAGSRIKAGEARVMTARQDLILRVSRAYFGLLEAEAESRVAANRRKFLQTVLDEAQASLKAGTGTIVEVHEARARVDGAEAALVRANNTESISRTQLEMLLHNKIDALNDVGSFDVQGPKPGNAEAWVAAALENRPVLEEARQQLNIARDKIEIAKRQRWPRLDFKAQAQYLDGNFLPDVTEREMGAGLLFSMPLYLGGAINAQTAQARAEALASKHTLATLTDRITVDTQSAFLVLRDSVAELKAAKQAMESARISMNATRKGFQLGTRTFVDFLDTTQNYYDARKDYFLSLYRHILARVELKGTAGVISERDLEAINSFLVAVVPDKDKPEPEQE